MAEIKSREDMVKVLVDVQGAKLSEEKTKYRDARRFLEEERKSYLAMDKLFRSFLEVYIDKYKKGQSEREKFKKGFLVCSLILLFISVVSPIVFCYFLLFRDVEVISAVAAIVGLLIEIISTIIVLPRTIAEYLFDKDENKQVIDIIKNMQTYNTEKHTHLSSHEDT